jgi:RNA polymerase sigma-70 factor (ECF subfamily)
MASTSQSIGNLEIMQVPEEKGLIKLAMRGDASAFESLYSRHKRALFQTALRVLGNVEDAEDALQEGLLAAYRNLKRFEGRSQFSTWLTRIVINASLMRRRSMRSRPAVSLENFSEEENTIPAEERFATGDPSPEEIYERRELNNLINANLAELSPVLRDAFVLRESQGLTTSEAARALGVSENTLKARLWRARQQLAERLAPLLRRGTGDWRCELGISLTRGIPTLNFFSCAAGGSPFA